MWQLVITFGMAATTVDTFMDEAEAREAYKASELALEAGSALTLVHDGLMRCYKAGELTSVTLVSAEGMFACDVAVALYQKDRAKRFEEATADERAGF